MAFKRLTVFEHLEELRKRVIVSLCFFIGGVVLAYNCVPLILPHIVKPVGKVVFITPAEAFGAYVTIALFGGAFISCPFVFYQFWQFLSAGLRRQEKKQAGIFGIISFLLFILGSTLGYMFIVPLGIKFLLSYATEYMVPMITASNYISFVCTLTIVFGLIFQIPIILIFLVRIGILSPGILTRYHREAIVVIFIIAAILTPPDVVSQILLAVPLLLLYELTLFLLRKKT